MATEEMTETNDRHVWGPTYPSNQFDVFIYLVWIVMYQNKVRSL